MTAIYSVQGDEFTLNDMRRFSERPVDPLIVVRRLFSGELVPANIFECTEDMLHWMVPIFFSVLEKAQAAKDPYLLVSPIYQIQI